MHLLSTGKSTILTAFENLETRSSYVHVNGGTTDFQFCAQTPIFVEVNKKSGIEILRVRNGDNQKKEIQRVRKVGIENVYCVAGRRQSLEDIGVGLSSGKVCLFNYVSSEYVHKFNAENIRKSVLYLDFNASDEYISSVLESGEIIIHGIKTRAKIDTVNIDGNSTLARFHPTKRFHLSVASYKGTVSVYDVHTKRKLFHNTDSHAAPCRDLCMSPAAPDTLVSVGYDCLINIFDTRRKTQPLQIRYCHPLSTVALSECGTFLCVGNLKGELISYDVRNTNSVLAAMKVHECAVTRIAFVPNDGDSGASFAISENTASTTNASESDKTERRYTYGDPISTRPSDALVRGKRDSFCDFLDFQANKGSEKVNSGSAARRDSYDCWDALQRKPKGDEPRVNLCAFGNSDTNSALNSVSNSTSAGLSDLTDCKKSAEEYGGLSVMPLRERSNNFTHTLGSKLVQIREELSLHNASSESDKENPVMDLSLMSRLQTLPADRNSTPNQVERCSEKKSKDAAAEIATVPVSATVSADFTQLLTEMDTRFRQLESEFKFQLEMNKWQIFTQNFNLWNKQNANNEAICEALNILLQTDPFVNEFVRLKQENEELKLQLQERQKNK